MWPFPALFWTSANKAEPITGAGAEQLPGVYRDMEMDIEENVELDEFKRYFFILYKMQLHLNKRRAGILSVPQKEHKTICWFWRAMPRNHRETPNGWNRPSAQLPQHSTVLYALDEKLHCLELTLLRSGKTLCESAGPLGHMFILKEKVFENQTFTEYLERAILLKLCKTQAVLVWIPDQSIYQS